MPLEKLEVCGERVRKQTSMIQFPSKPFLTHAEQLTFDSNINLNWDTSHTKRTIFLYKRNPKASLLPKFFQLIFR